MHRNTEAFQEFFWRLATSGALNNTIVFFMADHGIRLGSYFRTEVGMYEAKLPFHYILTPPWFKDKYPVAHSNLLFNSKHRLTTHFDTYRTLQDILHKQLTGDTSHKLGQGEYGDSLFRTIPSARGCQDAGVPLHWCPCGYFRLASLDDFQVTRAAHHLLQVINNAASRHGKCKLFKDVVVKSAKYHGENGDILLIVEMDIKSVVFRATVGHQFHENGREMDHRSDGGFRDIQIGDIERVDKYKKYTKCLSGKKKDEMIKKICICKTYLN